MSLEEVIVTLGDAQILGRGDLGLGTVFRAELVVAAVSAHELAHADPEETAGNRERQPAEKAPASTVPVQRPHDWFASEVADGCSDPSRRTVELSRGRDGLRASELGDLLDVSPETVSRWENSHRAAERSVWNTLADLVSDKLRGTRTTLDRLTAHKPHIPKRPVRLRLGMASVK